jgi:hypothetical protein
VLPVEISRHCDLDTRHQSMNDQGRPTRLKTGGFSHQWLGMSAIVMSIWVVGVIMLNWPPISRGFDEGRPLWFNLIMWALVNATAVGFLVYFGRRAAIQLSTRFFEEGIRQFQGTRTVFVPWAEVNEVRRERGIFEIRGRQVVRIDQDYYAEPNQVRRILADSVPDNTKGKRVLGPPVP